MLNDLNYIMSYYKLTLFEETPEEGAFKLLKTKNPYVDLCANDYNMCSFNQNMDFVDDNNLSNLLIFMLSDHAK